MDLLTLGETLKRLILGIQVSFYCYGNPAMF